MRYTAAVITVSDKGARGEREDTSGPAVSSFLSGHGWEVIFNSIIPDERELISAELIKCTDSLDIRLVVTVGGTGFSQRDITPEATLDVIEREARGIPEAMRARSMEITPRGCLSRSAAGLRKSSLIVNLPGSRKAALENLEAVIDSIKHGIDMLCSDGSADCAKYEKTPDNNAEKKSTAYTAKQEYENDKAVIKAVCTSRMRGTIKKPVDVIRLIPNWGIEGDAHAGNWHRQVSILGAGSVAKMQDKLEKELVPGIFAENILADGICFYSLKPGTRLSIGTALCEVTQVGKECHEGCDIRRLTGDCVMPREGIFVKVISGGEARAGDCIRVLGKE